MAVASLLLLTVFSSSTTLATLIGDEQYGKIEGGVFWTFHSRGVSIVNPESCEIEHNFDTDGLGDTLPRSWSKGVYMQIKDASGSQYADDDVPLTATPELLPRKDAYVLINSAEEEKNGGEVIVLSTTSAHKAPVVSRIKVAPKLGNAYAIHNRNQFWTHSDEEGYYFVIDLKTNLKDHTGHPIKVKLTTAHESQLLWEIGIEDSTLTLGTSNIGYATSKGEPHLFILDMLYHKQVDTYDFSKNVYNNTCPGATSLAYSKLNQHLYIECAKVGGILEFDVSAPHKPLFIAQHQHVGGVLLETPDQSYVTATDKGANAIHFFRPQKTGELSTNPYMIIVDGHPEIPSFYDHAETFDYIACMPLTQNTNQHHIDPILPTDVNGNPLPNVNRVVCDYWNECSQAQTRQDVANGMCLYADKDAKTQLLSATQSQMEDVQTQKEPFGQACHRCANTANYDNNKQECVCTPQCGACAKEENGYPTDVKDPLLEATGVACVDVKDALLNVVHAADLIPGAGAIRRQKAGTGKDAPTCGMEEPMRPHKRGANVYDASISTVPTNELILVDMRVQTLKCRVELPGTPQEVIYVPTSYHYKSASSNNMSSGTKSLIAILVIFVVGTFAMFVFRGSKFASSHSSNQQQQRMTDLELELQSDAGNAASSSSNNNNNNNNKDIELTNGNHSNLEEEKKDDGNPGRNNSFTIDDDGDYDNVVSPPERIIAQAEDSTSGGPSVHSGTLT